MKKILYILFVIIIFTACSKTEQEVKPKTLDDVQLATIGWGPVINPSTFSNNGFYETVYQPEGGANILYTDFTTGTQIYLCNRPECLHSENSCNSYFGENTDAGRLLMNKDKTLLVSICGEKAHNSDEYITKIVTMQPDGTDRKVAYEFPFNESTEGHRVVDEENLYLLVIVAPTGVNKPAKLKLTRVNLYTGEREDLETFDDDVKISAANKDTIYLQSSTTIGSDFYAYSLSKNKKSVVYSTKYEEAKGVMFEDNLYLFENESKQVRQINLITNEEKILEGKIPFDDLGRTYFLNIFDRHLFYQTISDTSKNWYALSFETGECIELTMIYQRFNENKSAYVLAEFEDKFLITRDIKSKTISLSGKGGESYTVKEEIPVHSIIKKSDYYAAKNIYTDITQID